MYGLWVVFLVIAGRAKVTTRNFPASLAGLAANIVLLILLVPPLGIAGAGLALCGAYVVDARAHAHPHPSPVRGRVRVAAAAARSSLIAGGMAAAGDLLLADPRRGRVASPALRLFVRSLSLLYLTGFAHAQELGQLRALLGRVRFPGRTA